MGQSSALQGGGLPRLIVCDDACAHEPAQEEAKDGPGEGQLADRLEAAVTCLKQVYSECPSYDQLVPALLQHGLANLKEHCHFVPGVPVAPMLAKPTTGVQEVLTRFGKVCTRILRMVQGYLPYSSPILTPLRLCLQRGSNGRLLSISATERSQSALIHRARGSFSCRLARSVYVPARIAPAQRLF